MNDTLVTVLCLAQFALLFLLSLGCFSLTGFSRTRLDEVCEKSGNGARFLEILRGWERASISLDILRLLIVVGVVATGITTWSLVPDESSTLNSDAWLSTLMKWVGLLLALTVSGIVLPRAYARTTGEMFLVTFWPMIRIVAIVVKPLTKAALWVDKVLHRLYDLNERNPNDPDQLAEEIRTIADAGERTGALDAHASLMIDQVMDLKDADVASVMTPRTEMRYIKSDLTIEEARQEILDVGHTRMPIIGSSTDDIVGILYAKDLLRYTGESAESAASLSEISRKPFFVPETTSVDRLLQTMKRKRVHLAIVLDEYGGVAGVVTMEDLLEEIVGDIDDEYDRTEPDPIARLSPTINELDARVHIDDLVEEFDYDLPEDRDRDYDTIGGFVVAHLGRIPVQNESFNWRDLKVTVLESDERRVVRIRIEHDDSQAHQSVDE
ncbi:MAG: hemolysin family protein [Planctomycetota bacterium]|mgnify:CR=1 FL=1|nr:hemolysin family protein [Planctomycetota bacterium]MDA1248908.1 hemolysin family protein [Planctomycetota bacterium]